MKVTSTSERAVTGVEAPMEASRLYEMHIPEPLFDLAICGAGPCGMTAGIYAQRAGLSTILIEQQFPGGQLNLATAIENYPGFAEPIPGIDLSLRMEEQVRTLGAEILSKSVVGISRASTSLDPVFGTERVIWRVALSDGSALQARSIIIATGASPRNLGLPGESSFTGHGISYCSTCDGGFFKGREVAVVGGGSTAVEDAIYLSRICRKVTLIHRRDTLRAERVLQERLFAAANIALLWNTVITGLQGGETLTGIELLDRKTGARSTLAVPGLFIAIGQDPGSAAFKDLLHLDASGYILADDCTRTRQPGIFAAGDVRASCLRQIVTALSDGARSASEAARYLNMDTTPREPA